MPQASSHNAHTNVVLPPGNVCCWSSRRPPACAWQVPRLPPRTPTVTVNAQAWPSRTSMVAYRATEIGKTPKTITIRNTISNRHDLSADHTGARWCYVDSAHHSSCQDLQHSARFPHNPWSYEACATPDRHQCGHLGYNGYQGFQGLYRAKGYGK